jgi:hypothetical protein
VRPEELFYVLLTVHLGTILGNDQLDALFLKRKLFAGTADSHSPECVIPDDVLIQFGPSDDEHLLLETCKGINKYIKKECIKLVITQNCIKMHGQQNIK